MTYKILVVDDEPKNLKLLRDILKSSGYSVLSACNGREAIDEALVHQPHLILMDLNLPVLNGLEATKILKNNPNTREIPVLVLSGTGPEDSAKLRNAGCDGFISKPFNLGDFRKKISEYLHKKSESFSI